jgi:hypothetical protein
VNPDSARRLVLLSLGGMFAITTVRHLQGRQPGSTYRRLWATGALAVVLSILADFAPEVAGPLALLVAMSYLIGAEDTIAEWLHGAIGTGGSQDSTGVGGNLTAPKVQNPKAGTSPGQRPT